MLEKILFGAGIGVDFDATPVLVGGADLGVIHGNLAASGRNGGKIGVSTLGMS